MRARDVCSVLASRRRVCGSKPRRPARRTRTRSCRGPSAATQAASGFSSRRRRLEEGSRAPRRARRLRVLRSPVGPGAPPARGAPPEVPAGWTAAAPEPLCPLRVTARCWARVGDGVLESGLVATCGAGTRGTETRGTDTCGTDTCGTDTCGSDTCGRPRGPRSAARSASAPPRSGPARSGRTPAPSCPRSAIHAIGCVVPLRLLAVRVLLLCSRYQIAASNNAAWTFVCASRP